MACKQDNACTSAAGETDFAYLHVGQRLSSLGASEQQGITKEVEKVTGVIPAITRQVLPIREHNVQEFPSPHSQ